MSTIIKLLQVGGILYLVAFAVAIVGTVIISAVALRFILAIWKELEK